MNRFLGFLNEQNQKICSDMASSIHNPSDLTDYPEILGYFEPISLQFPCSSVQIKTL